MSGAKLNQEGTSVHVQGLDLCGPDCILLAAGERSLEKHILKDDLQAHCRSAIRRHLLSLDPHSHLFNRIPRLPLPSAVKDYLLFHVSLEEDRETQ